MPPQKKSGTPNRGHIYNTRNRSKHIRRLERLASIIIRGPWLSFENANHKKSLEYKTCERTSSHRTKKSATPSTRTVTSTSITSKGSKGRKPNAISKTINPEIHYNNGKKPKGTRVFPQLSEIQERQRLRELQATHETACSITVSVAPNKTVSPMRTSKDQATPMKFYRALKKDQCSIFEESEEKKELKHVLSYSDSEDVSEFESSSWDESEDSAFEGLEKYEDTFSTSFSDSSFEDQPRSDSKSDRIRKAPRIKNNSDELLEVARWCAQMNSVKDPNPDEFAVSLADIEVNHISETYTSEFLRSINTRTNQ